MVAIHASLAVCWRADSCSGRCWLALVERQNATLFGQSRLDLRRDASNVAVLICL